MPSARPGPLCWLAIGFCEQEAFRRFAHARTSDEAKAFILNTCGVASRKELDTDPNAARLFHERVRRPFAYGSNA